MNPASPKIMRRLGLPSYSQPVYLIKSINQLPLLQSGIDVLHDINEFISFFSGIRVVAMHIHEQLPGIALNDFQDVQQPFISFRINVQPAGAVFGKGSADQMGQRQTGGDLPVMFSGG